MGNQSVKNPEYYVMAKQIDLPVNTESHGYSATNVNSFVKKAIYSSLDLYTQGFFCSNLGYELGYGSMSQDKKAEYQETSLKWLAKNKEIMGIDQDKFKVAREVYDDEKVNWYSNQFWKHCDMDPYEKSNHLEEELFCLSRSFSKKYKETDLVCNRVYQDYEMTRLHNVVRSINVNKHKMHGVVDNIGNGILTLKPLYQ